MVARVVEQRDLLSLEAQKRAFRLAYERVDQRFQALDGSGIRDDGLGEPGAVDAPFSATFQRIDGAPGSSIYVKETSDGDMTGWRAL